MKILKNIFLMVFLVWGPAFTQDRIDVCTLTAEDQIEPDDDHPYINQASFIHYNKSNSLIYVVNKGDNNILVFDTDLNYIRTIGRFGQGPGEFQKISAISTSREGNLVVTDRGRIQILTKTGEYLGGFRVQLRVPAFPVCSCIDSKGRLFLPYVAGDSLISVYSLDGKLLTRFGKIYEITKKYTGHDSKADDNLVHLRIDSEDNIYVVFLNKPILRKYNSDLSLVYERDYSHLSAIKVKDRENQETWSEIKGRRGFYIFNEYFKAVCLNDDYLYIHVPAEKFPVFMIEKKTGNICKEFRFLGMDKKNYPIDNMCCADDKIITSSLGNLLIIINK